MTSPATDAEIRPDGSPGEQAGDPAGEPTAVVQRYRQTVDRYRHARQRLRDRLHAWQGAAGRWWAWIARPLSLQEAWELSAVDPRRLPPRAPWWLVELWRLSNGTDRLAWFVLMLLVPSGLQGPLRWLAVRPTRRLGTYLVLAALIVGFAATGRGH